jgi:hypothetical protein
MNPISKEEKIMEMLTNGQLVTLILDSAEYNVLENETLYTFKNADSDLKITALARMIQCWAKAGSLQNYAMGENWDNWPEVSYANFICEVGKADPALWVKAQVFLLVMRDNLSEQKALRHLFMSHLRDRMTEKGLRGTESSSQVGAFRNYYKTTRTRWSFEFSENFFSVGKCVTEKEEGVRNPGFFGWGRIVVPKTETSHWVNPLKLAVIDSELKVLEGKVEGLKGSLTLEEGILRIENDVLAIRAVNNEIEVFIFE